MSTLHGKPLEPRRKTPARPYARKRSGPPSTTTILGALGKDGLQHGSAKETAVFAVDSPDEWVGLDREAAITRLRTHFIGLWAGRAAMGTLIHHINEAWTWGETVDIDELVAEMANADKQPVKVWQGRERLVAQDAEPYVDGLERFWLDHQPVTVATEEVVRYPGKWIGQRDWVADIGGVRWLLDLKTTAQQDAEKGLYLDSWRLQLASYAHAPEIVEYDADGKEIATHPNYPVQKCGIVHLRGDGAYSFLEVRAAGDELGTFMRLIDIYHWQKKGCQEPAPIDLTKRTEAEAAA